MFTIQPQTFFAPVLLQKDNKCSDPIVAQFWGTEVSHVFHYIMTVEATTC